MLSRPSYLIGNGSFVRGPRKHATRPAACARMVLAHYGDVRSEADLRSLLGTRRLDYGVFV
jgi:hypothetical protein